MIKKIFGVIILVFALVSVLASCGHEHAWGEWETAKSATCTVEGIKERYCSCGEKQTGTIMSLGHMFGEWSTVVDATCAENGKERRSCSCGEFEEREIEKLKTHTEVVDSYVAPSCTQTGLTEGKHCSVCNVILVPQTEVAMTEHSYVNKYDADCDACGFERIPACAHLNAITISGKPATCTADGLSNGAKCAKCGEVIVEQIVIEALGHTDGVWYTDKNATCTVEGLRHQECAVCHEKIDEDIIKPLGHTEGSWIVDEEATCTGNGRRHNNCTVCGDIAKEETITKLGHVDSDWIYDSQPTCTRSGERHKFCSRCNNTYKNETVKANGHTAGSTVVENRVDATCDTKGSYENVVYCTIESCKAEMSRTKKTISATGHNYVSYFCTTCNSTQSGVKPVYDQEDLQNIANDLSATYILMNDINCEGGVINPIGTNDTAPFTGIFDGRGYTISNYKVTNAKYMGIFGYNSGTIRNLNVEAFDFDVETNSIEELIIGGIVGYNAGVIEKCSVINGDIYVSSTCDRKAALICGQSIGEIKNCYATGKVYVTQSSQNQKSAWAAGITASNAGKIEKCFVDATLYAYGHNDGKKMPGSQYWVNRGDYGEAAFITAVSFATSSISDCFVMGSISTANNRVGDISGYCYDGSQITNCYKDESIVLCTSNNLHNYATDISLSAMSAKSFFSATVSWDSSVWDYTNVNLSNKVYPKLKQD